MKLLLIAVIAGLSCGFGVSGRSLAESTEPKQDGDGVMSKLDETVTADFTAESMAESKAESKPDKASSSDADRVKAEAEDGETQGDISAKKAAKAVKSGTEIAAAKGAEAPAVLSPIPEGSEISSGDRFAIDGKGFSIIAPLKWIVRKNMARSSLVIEARVSGTEYPRNIVVVRWKDPVLINEETAQTFEQRIVKTYPLSSPSIENFALRNHQNIQMEDGREAILIYTEFTGSGRKMMQAHVLLSSETDHYLVTYTDVAEHFENPSEGDPFLAEAWASMTSIQLNSPNPVAEESLKKWIMGVVGLLGIVGMATVTRKALAARSYRKFGNLEDGETDSQDAVADTHEESQTGTTKQRFKTNGAGSTSMTLDYDRSGDDADDDDAKSLDNISEDDSDDSTDEDTDTDLHALANIKVEKSRPMKVGPEPRSKNRSVGNESPTMISMKKSLAPKELSDDSDLEFSEDEIVVEKFRRIKRGA
jgi:hypothetical protein